MNDETTFIDTNVLVYAHDGDAGAKHQTARELVRGFWRQESGVLSIQVLQEFYVTLTRKLAKPIANKTARELIAAYQAWNVYSPNVNDVIAASALQERYSLSFWDAMIVIAAQKSGAARLLSEDMQSGQRIDDLLVENPFA